MIFNTFHIGIFCLLLSSIFPIFSLSLSIIQLPNAPSYLNNEVADSATTLLDILKESTAITDFTGRCNGLK